MTLVSKDVHGVAILRSLEVVEVIRGHARSLGSKINVLSYQDSITKSLENLLKKFWKSAKISKNCFLPSNTLRDMLSRFELLISQLTNPKILYFWVRVTLKLRIEAYTSDRSGGLIYWLSQAVLKNIQLSRIPLKGFVWF